MPSPSEAGLADGALTLVLFDPYMYNRRLGVKAPNTANLYPEDIEMALDAMSRVNDGILIQLSTYDTNDNNPQGAVISSINSKLVARDFTLCSVVPANKKMMSLVYARRVPWSRELTDLPYRFQEWLDAIPG